VGPVYGPDPPSLRVDLIGLTSCTPWVAISVKTYTKSFSSQIFSLKSCTEPPFFSQIVDRLHSPQQRATHNLKNRGIVRPTA
jgi:hypothetical protein